MAAADDVDQLIEQFHLASDEFLKGNPEPVNKLWSRREDVTEEDEEAFELWILLVIALLTAVAAAYSLLTATGVLGGG
jgi:hypothetical protein